MSIIQMLFTGAGAFTTNEFFQNETGKPSVTVIPVDPITDQLFGVPTRVRNINFQIWGGGGASGSTFYGNSGVGGPGGYISGVIPVRSLPLNIAALSLRVGGGGGNPDYYNRPLGEYLEFNRAQVQYINSASSSSDATYSTITPVAGATSSSVSNVTYSTISQVTSATSSSDTTYSTITPVAGATASSVSNVTYSTISQVAGADVSSISSPTYNTVTYVDSVSNTNVTSLTIPAGVLEVGDVILVASVCATGTTPQNNPNTPTGYTILENATVTGNVNYKLSYRRVTNTNIDSLIDGLSDITTDNSGGGGADFIVAHTASIFRNVIGVGDPITSLFTSTGTSTSIDPPLITPETPNYMSVAFGFHNDRSITPTGIPAGYTQTVVQAVGTNANATNEATIMVAHRSLSTSAQENPGSFTVPDPENYVAITVGLMPTKTLSTISGSMTLTGLQENDIVLVSSVSDGGTMNLPTGFNNLSNATGATNLPAYRISWKRVTAAELSLGSLTIGGLSTSGLIIGGQANNQPAGVAHYATAFRDVSTTSDPTFTVSIGTPTGNPDSPSITTTTANHAILSFGFLNNRSLSTVTAPTGYTLLNNGVNVVGSDGLGITEATSVSAFRNLTTTLTENPGAFTVTGSGAGANYAAVTVALSPVRTLSTITGTMSLTGLQADDIVLVSSVSDGGTMSLPTGFTNISNSGAGASPAYRVSWRRVVTGDAGSLTISNLSLSGTTTGGLTAGVAHYATAFRGVNPTAAPPFITATATPSTGNPDSPSVGPFPTINYTSVSFGFLNNTGFPTVAAPTNYTKLSSLEVSDNTPGTEATSMVAYRNLTTTAAENPATFNVTGIGGEDNAAVTVALSPTRTSSPITGQITISGLQADDIVLVSSVSDGGTMSLPNAPTGAFSNISNATGSANSPAYRVSWKRVVAGDLSVGSLTISNLSLSGTVIGGDADGENAGVAHYATAFRGVSTTTNPLFTAASTGTGNPNSPSINVTTSNHTVLSFGFLNDTGYTTVAAPSQYTQLSTLRVSDNTPGTEATSMVAYRDLSTELTADPGAFNVTGIGGEDYAAVTVALSPVRTLSTITGTMSLTGLQENDIVLVSSVSDGGTMNLPNAPTGAFSNISNATGSTTSPAYRVSWKRVVAGDLSVGSLTISNLSLSGTTTGGLAAGVAHYATAFRGADPTALTPFINATSTGTGNPDSPTVSPLPTVNYTSVSFGFLNNTGFPTINPPTSYTQLSSLEVSDNTPGTEATSMIAYRTSLPSGAAGENPGAFTVTGIGGENYAAVTVALRPYLLPSATDLSVLTLPGGIQEHDIILVASVSDGGILATPSGYSSLASQTGNGTPSYQVSWKRVSATIDTQITGLSAAGQIDGGDGDGAAAGIAHIASVYRGASLTTNPTVSINNGNGAPDPQQITGLPVGAGVVPFGFLDNRSISDANITAPTTPSAYTKTITRAVGQDNNGDDEATVMSAFREVTAGGTENPGAFGVTGAGGQPYSAVTAVLTPQVSAKFSTITGGCGGSSGGYSAIFYTSGGVQVPLVIAGGGGGGGGGTALFNLTPAGGFGGSGGPIGLNGGNGTFIFDPTIASYRPAGAGGKGGTDLVGGAGGATWIFPGSETTGTNPGEVGVAWSTAPVGGFDIGGRGANSPGTDISSVPLYGANATGGWKRGSGGGSSRNINPYTAASVPTDCGGAGGAGYYGGGGGGSGLGGGGGGGGGGSNYVNPSAGIIVNSNLAGIGTVPGDPNGLNLAGYGGAAVSGAGVAYVQGNFGKDGLIILSYVD